MDARIGYGLAAPGWLGEGTFSGHGMLTPYTEMTFGASDSYRIGMNWKAGSRFDLTVLGERREPGSSPAEHALLLKGEVRF